MSSIAVLQLARDIVSDATNDFKKGRERKREREKERTREKLKSQDRCRVQLSSPGRFENCLQLGKQVQWQGDEHYLQV